MNRVSPKALLISLAIMLALDTLGGMILTIFFASQSLHENTTPEQTRATVEAMNQSSGFLLSALAYGTITTILGGYLAARTAISASTMLATEGTMTAEAPLSSAAPIQPTSTPGTRTTKFARTSPRARPSAHSAARSTGPC